ncbi:methionyl-tRNA formyltransferase [Candidatus Magnetoovum chiemensis]|nr:methionyl-tRNA formyltransferase [Candidatus Magnetoovum chiemensis]
MYARALNKEDGLINWSSPAKDIHNLVRGLCPWPRAYTSINGQTVKILKTNVITKSESVENSPGSVIQQDENGLFISTRDGIVSILELQPESRNPMSYKEFIRGRVKNKKDVLYIG